MIKYLVAPLMACNDVHQFVQISTSIVTNFDVETTATTTIIYEPENLEERKQTPRTLCICWSTYQSRLSHPGHTSTPHLDFEDSHQSRIGQSLKSTKNASHPINQQKEKANEPKPSASTTALLSLGEHPTSLLSHLRTSHKFPPQHRSSSHQKATATGPVCNRSKSGEILLRPLQTTQTLRLARERRSARRESAGGVA